MPMPERIPVHAFFRVVNPYADTFTRVCQWVGVVTKEDDPDVEPCRIVRFSDCEEAIFFKEELEPYATDL